MKEKTRTIRQTVFLTVPPAEVYDAFLKAKKHAGFTQSKATCDASIGGEFTAYDGYIFGTILELEEGRRIVQKWQTTEWPADAQPSIVEIILKEKEGATELTMVHSSVPAEQAESYRQGWIDYYWDPLKEYFQNR